MTPAEPAPALAYHVADHLRAPGPWDVFAERSRRYEIHLNGRSVELVRGPILLEGYGVRVFRAHDGATGVGFQASTDPSPAGLEAVIADAETLSRQSTFPAKQIELPSEGPGTFPSEGLRDTRLWDRPMEAVEEYVAALLRAFDGLNDVVPSFGSVRATLTETSLANSAGLRAGFTHTQIWSELALKAHGGPEGRPPGEYWVNDLVRRLEPAAIADKVRAWAQYARDVRVATAPPTGDLPVVLPPSVAASILPQVLGTRFTGGARLREIAPEVGSPWAHESVTIHDDGMLPWAVNSAPIDDEGTRHRRRTLLDHGKVTELLYDVRYSGVYGLPSTGNAVRGRGIVSQDWRRFLHAPADTSTTIVVEPGTGGSDTELIEAAHDGIWVQQLGWAVPDPISGAFGGEIRIGYRIRNGKLAEPVRGGTVGGVVLAPSGGASLLNNLSGIGSRSELTDQLSTPTLLVTPLTVSGTA